MVHSIPADDLRLTSGRTIGQFRKQAKQLKKKHKEQQPINLAQALNEPVSEYGLSGGWHTLIQHAKWMVQGDKVVPPVLPESPSTLVLGSHPGFSRIAYMLWEDALERNNAICDIVIDCTGNPLTYAYMHSHLKKTQPYRGFHAFDLMSRVACGTRFAMDYNSLTSLGYAVANGEESNYEDIVGYIMGPDHDLPKHVVDQFDYSQEHGLFRLLARQPTTYEETGMMHTHLFHPSTTLLFSLANSQQCTEEYNQQVVQILRMIELESNRDPNKAFRITLIQPSDTMKMPDGLIERLCQPEGNQLTIVSQYPRKQGSTMSWVTPLIDEFEVFLAMKTESGDTPDSLACLSPQLSSLDGVKGNSVNGLLFHYGELVDMSYRFTLRSVVEPSPVIPME